MPAILTDPAQLAAFVRQILAIKAAAKRDAA